MKDIINEYFETLGALPARLESTDRVGHGLSIEQVFDQVITLARQAHDGGYKLMFIGNFHVRARQSRLQPNHAVSAG